MTENEDFDFSKIEISSYLSVENLELYHSFRRNLELHKFYDNLMQRKLFLEEKVISKLSTPKFNS